MTKTLLEIVQGVLVDINGDEVNSISDTEESEDIAKHVQSTYYNIVSNSNWKHSRRLTSLVPYSDSTYPTHMKLADNVKEIISIYYNTIASGETRKNYVEMKYLEPDAFLIKVNSRDNTQTNISVINDPSGVELLIQTDKAPQYYTSFDDITVVFDSYDSDVDSVLQESKTQVQAYIIPTFTLEDSFVPDLPPDAFALLEEETISRVQWKDREFRDIRSEQEASRQRRWLSRKSWRVSGGISYPNYGKKRRG